MKMCNQVSPKVEKDDLSGAQLHGGSDKMNNLIRACRILWRAGCSRKPARGEVRHQGTDAKALLFTKHILTAVLDKHLPKRL